MKKLCLLLMAVLIAAPFIYAEEDDYSIELDLDKNSVQVGDPILFEGNIFRNNDILDDQINVIFYIGNNGSQNQVFLSVFDGTFSFTPRLKDLDSGSYQISVELFDLNGEPLQYFENIRQVTIDNKLILDLQVEKDQLIPGEKLQILGVIQRSLDKQNVPLSILRVYLDGQEYITEVSNGNLDYEIELSDNIGSDYHTVLVEAEDTHGNKGETSFEIYVIPQQESIEIKLDQKTYYPGETINMYAVVYDQASQEVVDELTFQLYDADGKKVYEETMLSTASGSFLLEGYALPGAWIIKVESSAGMESEKSIDIPVLENLDIELIGQTLKIRNSGNVRYDELLIIDATSELHNRTIEVRTKLIPGGNMSLDLYKELKDMDYVITILNTEQVFDVKIFDDRGVGTRAGDWFEGITGQLIRTSGSKEGNGAAYMFAMIVLFLVILVFLYKKPNFNIIKKVRRRKPKKARSKAKPKTQVIQRDDDIEGFKSRILKDIDESNIRGKKKEEDKFNVQPFLSVPKDNKPKKFEFDKPLRK
jgi:hypothetical protein